MKCVKYAVHPSVCKIETHELGSLVLLPIVVKDHFLAATFREIIFKKSHLRSSKCRALGSLVTSHFQGLNHQSFLDNSLKTSHSRGMQLPRQEKSVFFY